MNKKTVWLILAASATGLAIIYLTRHIRHRKWKKERARIIEKARKKHYGEFVL